MNASVFRHALGRSSRTLIVLTLSAAAFIYLVMLAYPSFSNGTTGGFLEDPPRYMRAFLGGEANLLAPTGWVASAMTHPIMLALLIAAGSAIAAGAVATEVESGTIDLVLSRPVGRTRFLLAKAAAAAVAVTTVQAGAFAGALVARATLERVDEIALADMAAAFGVSWLLFVALAMVAVLVSTRTGLRGRAVGVSVGLAVGWFFVNFVALLFDEVSGLRFASPFHYFRAADLLGGRPSALDPIVLASLAVVALGTAVTSLRNRDLT